MRKFGGRSLGQRLVAWAAMASLVGVAVTIGHLPSETSAGSLALRAGAAFAAGLGLIVFVWRSLRAMGDPPPAQQCRYEPQGAWAGSRRAADRYDRGPSLRWYAPFAYDPRRPRIERRAEAD